MALIISDDREDNGALPHLQEQIDGNNVKYSKLGITNGGGNLSMIKKRINVADYAIALPPKPAATCDVGSARILFIIERKTWKDLAHSIKDGRLESQHENMNNFAATNRNVRILYIIEGKVAVGNDAGKKGGIELKALRAKLLHMALKGSLILYTADALKTTSLLTKIARSALQMVAKGSLIVPVVADDITTRFTRAANLGDAPEEITAALTAIRDYIAKRTVSSTMLNSVLSNSELTISSTNPTQLDSENSDIKNGGLEDARNATITGLIAKQTTTPKAQVERMWQGFRGIGANKAAVLMKKYTFAQIITRSDRTVLRREIADLECSGVKFGDTLAGKIVNSVSNSDSPVIRAQNIETGASVLEGITGVTKEFGTELLGKWTIAQLCMRETIDEVANYMRQNKNKKVGLVIASRIHDMLNLKVS